MRILTPVVAAFLLVGCASQLAAPRPQAAAAAPGATHSATATSLAFDPPIAGPNPAPDLPRETRGPVAANGVVQTSTSTFDVTTSIDDATVDGSYDQQSVTERTGTVQR